jgi:hypothetical protein
MVPREEIILAVAGMFNTGTNLLDVQMQRNILGLNKNSIWQVPWGKHRMAHVKWEHTAPDMEKYDKKYVLPVVIIRDPFAWMQSMCNNPYAAGWRHGKLHCPNLIPTPEDKERFKNLKESFQVKVKFDKDHTAHFDSLVHLWSEWYQEYLKVEYPVLMSKLRRRCDFFF